MLSGAARADQIRATGATPATLPPQGDLDLDLLESDSGREDISGVKRLNFDIVAAVRRADAASGEGTD